MEAWPVLETGVNGRPWSKRSIGHAFIEDCGILCPFFFPKGWSL